MSDAQKLTIRTIAEKAGVSKTTVSFYLNGKTERMSPATQEKIRAIIEETGYTPSATARALTSKKTRMIGVLIGTITNGFANQIVRGIDDVLWENENQLTLGNTDFQVSREKEYIKQMLAMNVDGFIIQPSIHFEEVMPLLEDSGKPLVFIDSRIERDDILSIQTNNYDVVKDALEHLSKEGYTNFLMICHEPDAISTRKTRFRAFTDTLKLQDLEGTVKEVCKDISAEEIRAIVEEELKKNKKTAVYVLNGFLLPQVYLALREIHDKMPDRIGFFGVDNEEWTSLSSPTVTTIVQPAYQEGCQAASLLLEAMKEQEKSQAISLILPCSIDWQQST